MPILATRHALSSLSLRALSSSSRACGSSVAGRVFLPHQNQQQQLLRLQQRLNTSPYSTSPSSHPSPSASAPPQNRRAEYKILPFIVLLGIGSASYILLLRSRIAKRAPPKEE